ncbi:M48 family metallopeptidase [Pseudokineococcus marinus]|uniref:M48 metallopeptidase family protein n=1 Tax=Pseudokineococcus marinus TaxID=351215 RepID=UPI001FE59438|nr:M48 family metallopeptidase [Pseudokineococcus marinus]
MDAGGGAARRSSRDDAAERPPVQVRRSARRRRTVTAFREDGAVVVCIPARFSRAEEAQWVERMVARLSARDARRHLDDGELSARARSLSERYLDGRAVPTSVRWVGNQRSRWGSTTPADGTIRLSSSLQGLPPWVVDYVLLHELAHLLVPGHGDDFWRLLTAYPRTERARGYLEGWSAADARREGGDAGRDADEHEDADDGADGGTDGSADGGTAGDTDVVAGPRRPSRAP